MNIFCDECKKNIATVFLTKISSSEVSRVQLCEECAKRMEETTEAANLLAFLPNLISNIQAAAENALEEDFSGEIMTCASCGTSWSDFQKMGFLGCATCYKAFGNSLMDVIRDFHEATEHVGKTPGKLSERARLRRKLVELERDLERQIAEERYEAAASVRDKIKKIKGKLEGKGEKEDGEER